MKGIILAGGAGTRLYPLTLVTSKQLLPVYDKPMIFYPLSTLMLANIREILIISTPEDTPRIEQLLGDGSKFGIELSYAVQEKPEGLAQAFTIGREFIGDEACAMVLGDNIFYGNGLNHKLRDARRDAENGKATIFGYYVEDPKRFGIMEFERGESRTDSLKVISVEEKPNEPKSNYAIVGLYFYPKGVSDMADNVKPSARGELEITTLNDMYLQEGRLNAQLLADIILHERRNIGEGSDRTGNLAGFHFFRGGIEAFQIAFHFFIPQSEFHTERRDLGMHAMGSAHHDRVLVLQGVLFQDLHEIEDILPQNGIGLLIADAVGGIDDVGAGHTVVDPLFLFTEAFGNASGKGDDVMSCLSFDLKDPVDVKSGICSDLFDIFFRNHAQFAPGFVDHDLNVQPGLKFRLFTPDVTHYFTGIPVNHIHPPSLTRHR